MSKAKKLIESLNMYEMANLRPDDTGLPFFIWVDEMGGYRKSKHSLPRIKLAKGSPKNFVASVSIDLEPIVLSGSLDSSELNLVKKWIGLNLGLLRDHWNGSIGTKELFASLKS